MERERGRGRLIGSHRYMSITGDLPSISNKERDILCCVGSTVPYIDKVVKLFSSFQSSPGKTLNQHSRIYLSMGSYQWSYGYKCFSPRNRVSGICAAVAVCLCVYKGAEKVLANSSVRSQASLASQRSACYQTATLFPTGDSQMMFLSCVY